MDTTWKLILYLPFNMPGSAFLLATFSALYLPMKGKCAFPSVSEQASELASKERMVEMDS